MPRKDEARDLPEADQVVTDEAHEPGDADEVEEVLDALRALLGRVGSPVVRACLEEAAEDIAHLAGRVEAA